MIFRHKATFWSIPHAQILEELETEKERGLTVGEARQRLIDHGRNILKPERRTDSLTLLLSQFKSPIILIFIFTAGLSFFLGNSEDAIIIIAIVLVSGILGFWQERGATNAVTDLLAIVQTKSKVIRDGNEIQISLADIVPGDIIILNAGDSIPGDSLILESKDLYVNEATLTGESFPIGKSVKILPPETPLRKRINTLFSGTYVVSGTAKAVVVNTGTSTELGKISDRLRIRAPQTEFEHGVKRFGYFLVEITLMLVIAIFAINVYFARSVLESFLFALALAIGLTPQLLPAIISVNLAHGAKRMALKKVIVRRLSSIENLGSMNMLCSDKTGTLTVGKVTVQHAIDIEGKENEKVILFAYLNSFYETGFENPIDEAIRAYRQFDMTHYHKLDEVPYDFIRKRLSVLVSSENETHILITKGALHNMLAVCSSAEIIGGKPTDISIVKEKILERFDEISGKGFRILGIAYRNVAGSYFSVTKEDEVDMTFLGFLILSDSTKPGIVESIQQLKKLGISIKIISGDNKLVAAYVGQQVGILNARILTGSELNHMNADALQRQVNEVDIFAEVEPNQKEHVILALKKSGNVVGYMGDGINDSPALHAADVGISVDTATDVVKDAADIVLLEKEIGVLADGVKEGRITFANTMKYLWLLAPILEICLAWLVHHYFCHSYHYCQNRFCLPI